ncbi:MAG: hypothetical protein H7246_01080 [Phycisphaerae bacterium]|nr:hypothetical protein [Saprospiraceae bacterium]
MKNLSQIATALLATLIFCFIQPASGQQWGGNNNNSVIYPANINAKVGIGISTPATQLHVKSGTVNPFRMESTQDYNWMSYYTAGTYKGYLGLINSPYDMEFGTSNTNPNGKVHLSIRFFPKLTVDTSGNIGIGTTSPALKLHVKGTGSNFSLFRLESATNATRMEFYTSTGNKAYAGASDSDLEIGTVGGTGGKTHLVTNNIRRLTVDNFGNVGIGIQSPNATLHVKSSSTISTPLQIESGASVNTMEYLIMGVKKGYTSMSSTDMEFGTSSGNGSKLHLVTEGVKRITIMPTTGIVGIGTVSPSSSAQLTVKGSFANILRLESTQASNYISLLTTPPGGVAITKGYMGIYSGNNDLEIRSASTNLSGNINIATANSASATGNINLATGGANQLTVFANGNVGIGTTTDYPYKLSVNGAIRAKEVRVESGWADYVFNDDFRLRPLAEVEQFIRENKHLPDVTPASEIQKDGLQVAKQMTEMMQKVEELTLYIIQLDKENTALKVQVARLETAHK